MCRVQTKIGCLLVMWCIIAVSSETAFCRSKDTNEEAVRVAGSCSWLMPLGVDVAQGVSKRQGDGGKAFSYRRVSDGDCTGKNRADFDILLHYVSGVISKTDLQTTIAPDARKAGMKCRHVGSLKVMIVANFANPAKNIRLDQLKALLLGETNGDADAPAPRVFGYKENSVSSQLLRRRCLLRNATNEQIGRAHV